MKKILSLILTLFVCLSLCLALYGCGGDTDNNADDNYESGADTENDGTEDENDENEDGEDDNGEPEHIHSYSAATCLYPERCACGATRGHALSHDYSDATCTNAAKCNKCGSTAGSALGHDYEEATCTTPKFCKRCGLNASDALGHDYRDATCTTAKICKRCEDIVGDPLGHSFSDATCFLPQTCAVCNETTGDPLGHTYVNDVCIRCEQVDPDTLPVPLENLWVISSYSYEVKDSCTDSYGNNYTNAHQYRYNTSSVHNLNAEFSKFTGTVICPDYSNNGGYVVLTVYVDDVAVYTTGKITKETSKIDFSIDVTGATKLKIAVTNYDYFYNYACIVNAKLER